MSLNQNQQDFSSVLLHLKETARLQQNVVTREQLDEELGKWKLDERQLSLIENYLRENHIGIDEPIDEDDYITKEDKGFLDMFLEELKGLPVTSDGEKRAVTMSALAGDGDAKAKLVEIYLPDVVEISKLYAGQGVSVEDLIGEGNLALSSGVNMLECVAGIDEVEGFLIRMVMDAMEESIGDDNDSRQIYENVLERVNDVNDKARELYEALMRKVSAREVADELGVSEEDVLEAVRLSDNKIEFIEGVSDAK